ncbi:MAG: hypothetical protein E7458_06985 [Ruminococcaceae bacterium]|nr:hypothetical protein [Oscillospiraceae bacterium]
MNQKLFTAAGPGYYEVKDHLFDQYQVPAYRAETGLSAEELEAGAAAIMARDGIESRQVIRSELFAYVLDHARIDVDPVDWFADHFDQANRLLWRLREGWRTEVGRDFIPTDAENLRQGARTGAFSAELDLGHISPGWQFLLKEGAVGILQQAKERLANAADDTAREFYTTVITVYEAFLRFMARLEAEARLMGEAHPEHADRMAKLSDCLHALQHRAPETLYEALQAAYLFHQMIEFEGEYVRSMGSFELNFGRFYEADLAAGRITEEDARELIRYFWMKFFAWTRGSGNGKNFYFGGLVDDEHDQVGPLSYLAMELFYELNTTDPKLSVRLSRKTPEPFRRLVAKCLRDGRTNMVIVNDEETLSAIRGRGIPYEDSFRYLLIGCYEPAIEGKEVACNMCIKFNLAKSVELALHNGVDPMSGEHIGIETGDSEKFETFEQFYAAYEAQLAHQLKKVHTAIAHYEENWARINPEPFISATFLPCLESGRDISQNGAAYNNTGCMGGGLANAADSLMSIKQTVYDEGRYTMAELKSLLASNFAENPREKLYLLHRVPKWGNNDEQVDAIARRIAESYTGLVNGVPNGRGGQFTASMFTLDYCFSLGHRTGALPDGREAGHYIAKGIGAMTGCDRAGVTAHIASVAKLDFGKIPNGSVLDLYLHPSAVDGEKGIDTLLQLIDAYFTGGGYGVQFNILNADDLREAQRHPEEYATLQVRVCGWNVYFVTMDEEMQNHFIETTMQMV